MDGRRGSISGGRIPRTQAMKPKLRAHDSDRFTAPSSRYYPLRGWLRRLSNVLLHRLVRMSLF